RLLLEADREAGGRRPVLGGEVGGEGVGLLIEQEVDRALAEQGDRALAVLRHRGEAELLQVLAHAWALALRRGELDELEAVDSHRGLESGDFHAEVGLGAHGVLLEGSLVATRGRAACVGWMTIYSFT